MSTDVRTPRSPSSTTPSSSSGSAPAQASADLDPAKLPDDTTVLKQMIAELIAARRVDRRELAELHERLHLLLRRGRREEPLNPNQPLLFPELAQAEPAAPAPPQDEEPPSRRGRSRPHGRRRPADNLRREPRRYELTAAERLCPDCGAVRPEIGVESSNQLDYKPAEVFVIEHQRVKYACKCCEGQVVLAPN